jgi:2-polyprenyl-3-methyl-5-hydroxy-6-metoxy-1,4-benzoquinol methylase
MGQINDGIYSLLKWSAIFEGLHSVIVKKNARSILADQYIRANPGDRLLDIGCGPASMRPYLNEVIYIGIDPEPAYIQLARTRHGTHGTFIQAGVQDIADRLHGDFDIVIAIGVLHHLDDTEAHLLFEMTRKVLKPGGRLVTSDPVLRTPQNPIARLAISFDRGRNVRSQDQYISLAKQCFQRVRPELRSDFMRIPYDHCILVCDKPADMA